MKILKESKEELPISFLTAFVSKGWEEVGILKEEIKAIKEEFKGTKKVEELLQDLIDAYLVCIGQTELLMKDKSYIEMPEEEKEDKKDLSEDLLLKVTPLVDVEPIVAIDNAKPVTACSSCIAEPVCDDLDDCEACTAESPVADISTKNYNTTINKSAIDNDAEQFEYFCDFDEPDPTVSKLTDEDLYQNN